MSDTQPSTPDVPWRENFLSPTGEFHLGPPAPGGWFGNRGNLHGADRRRVHQWENPRWLACRTYQLGSPDTFMTVGHHTEVFFHDEATAFAAGHRPCFQCRRADYYRFLDLFAQVRKMDRKGADAMDRVLHAERLHEDGRQRRHTALCADLPDGTFVQIAGEPWVVVGPSLHHWSPTGYDRAMTRPDGEVEVLTPACTVDVLRAGFVPEVVGVR